MAKAKNISPAKRLAKAKAEATSDQASVDEAFHLMLAQFQPHAARHRLDVALQAGEVRLRVNGTVVDPNFITACLRVAARTEPDGRWIAYIEATRALVPGEYAWTVSRAEVADLLHPPRRVQGSQTSRLLPLLRELYPPDGMPPTSDPTNVVMRRVLDEYQARGWGKVSREAVEKAIGRGRYGRR